MSYIWTRDSAFLENYILTSTLECFTLVLRDMVEKLLKHVTSSKLHAQYAKAREADKKYMEAAWAYEKARDYESAIR